MTKEFEQIKTGVIGVGSMGQNHARIYNEVSNLVAVADPNEEQGRKVADRFGVAWYKDYKNMLADVDAVSIAVPTFLHRIVAEEVSKAGVHMLVEKPLAGSIEDATAIVELADSANVTLAVGHVERFNPIISYAKKFLEQGRWGDVLTLSSKRFSHYPERIHDVGVLYDLAIHDIDIICYLLDEKISGILASGGKARNKEHEDYVSLILEFMGGQIGICETNWLTPMKVREMSLTTTSHYINLNYLSGVVSVSKSEFGKIDDSNLFQPPIDVWEQTTSPKGEEPLKAEILDFIQAFTRKVSPLVNGKDGLRAVKIVQNALVSINEDRNTLLKSI